MATTADLMTLQQQIRQEIADSFPAEAAKPYRISDLIPRSWDGSHDFRNLVAELHLWMQAWSDQAERTLVRVESVDKVDRSTLAEVCTEADFRTFQTALYRTTHEPLRTVQQEEGQRGLEAWQLVVDRSSACAALISTISERDRAKDVEQIDDSLRNFTNDTNKYEGRFGEIRDEEKILAVKKSMPESLQNYRFLRRVTRRAGEHNRQGHDAFGIEGEEN